MKFPYYTPTKFSIKDICRKIDSGKIFIDANCPRLPDLKAKDICTGLVLGLDLPIKLTLQHNNTGGYDIDLTAVLLLKTFRDFYTNKFKTHSHEYLTKIYNIDNTAICDKYYNELSDRQQEMFSQYLLDVNIFDSSCSKNLLHMMRSKY